jgi:hypothetical protein
MATPIDSLFKQQLHRDFGIDWGRVDAWHNERRQGSGTDAPFSYKGYDASAQYDRVFKIAALNRQIRALRDLPEVHDLHEIQGKQSGLTKCSIAEIIARAEGKRVRLIQMLRSSPLL